MYRGGRDACSLGEKTGYVPGEGPGVFLRSVEKAAKHNKLSASWSSFRGKIDGHKQKKHGRSKYDGGEGGRKQRGGGGYRRSICLCYVFEELASAESRYSILWRTAV